MKSVQISILDEPSFEGGGFARLVLHAMGRGKRDQVSLSFRRQSELDPFLGPSGWQSGEHFHQAREVSADEQDLLLLIGPEVSSYIEDYTTLEISIPELGLRGVLVWEGVTPPFDYSPPPLPKEPKPVEPEVEEPSEQATEQKPVSSGSAVFEINNEDRIKISGVIERGEKKETFNKLLKVGEALENLTYDTLKERGQGVLTLDVETGEWSIKKSAAPPRPAEEPPEEKKSPIAWIAAIILLLIVAAGAGYAFWPAWYEGLQALWQEDETPQPAPDPAPGQTQEPAPALGSSCPESSSLALSDALQKLNTAKDAGDRAEKSALLDEARFLLRCGINRNHGASMMLYAEQIDSIDFQEGFVTQPDDFQALELYRKACEGGTRVSRERLDQLKAAIEEKAAAGDPTANQTLLLLWPKVEEACPS